LKLKELVILILLFSSTTFSQLEISFGGYLGGGSFKGNSTSIGGFTTSLFADANIPLFEEVYPRVSFILTKDYNAILPNTNKPYNPYLMGLNFKGITTQYFENKMFLEEGVGLLVLNDRTLIDTDILDFGIVISLSAGFDLRNINLKGFKVGAGAEYGLTFINTLPKYSSLHIYVHYTI